MSILFRKNLPNNPKPLVYGILVLILWVSAVYQCCKRPLFAQVVTLNYGRTKTTDSVIPALASSFGMAALFRE